MERSLKLMVEPKWDKVEEVRTESSEFLKSHGFSNETACALTMVVSELIENSIKYGRFNLSENRVVVTIDIDEDIVTIEVINPVDETVYDHLKKLDRRIQWIRGHQDPFEAYIERLRDVSKRPLDDEESGLGLVRIAYEGKAILDFFLGDEDLLSVSAVSQF
jgi:hypothetical protein